MYPFVACFPLDVCPGVGLQGPMVALFLVFQGISLPFAIVAVPVYIPIKSVGGDPSLHALFIICCFWIF